MKIERGMKKYPGGLIFRFFDLMGSSLVPGNGAEASEGALEASGGASRCQV